MATSPSILGTGRAKWLRIDVVLHPGYYVRREKCCSNRIPVAALSWFNRH